MRSIELSSPLAKIRPRQPHYDLPIAGTNFPTPSREILERNFHRRPPYPEDIASTSDASLPSYSVVPSSFDFRDMMSML